MQKVMPILLVVAALGIMGYIFGSTIGGGDSESSGPPPRDRAELPPEDLGREDVTFANGGSRTPGDGPRGAGAGGAVGDIRVTVSEEETGMGIPDAIVKVSRGRYRGELRTDGNGSCDFPGVPAGKARVRVLTVSHEDPPMSMVDVLAGRTAVASFDVSRGAEIRGRVLDAETGEPVPGARIASRTSAAKSCLSGEDGSYRLTGFGPGTAMLQAEADRYPRHRQSVTVSSRDEDVVQDLALVRGAVVRGIVKDPRGTGLAGVSVSIRRTGQAPVLSGPDGRFALEAVPPNQKVYITAEREGYVPAQATPLELRPGEEMDGLELVLATGATVRGRVLLSDGSPAVGAVVRIAPQAGPGGMGRLPTTKTGTDGSFTLTPVAAGDHRITATLPGTIFVQDDVTGVTESAVIEGIELRLGSAVVISGVVRDHAGKPAPGVMVLARPVDTSGPSRWGSGRSDSTGKFSLRGLLPGAYSVRARSPQGGLESAAVEVPAGTTDLSLFLPAPGRLSGRVVGAAGEPVTAYSLTILPAPGATTGSRIFRRIQDPDGAFEVEDLAPGTYLVSASGAEGFSDPAPPVTVSAGSGAEGVVLTMRSGGTLRGRVIGNDGQPVVGARVNVTPAPGAPRGRGGRGTSNADGTFEIKGLRPGDYRVTAFHDGNTSLPATFSIGSGNLADVLLAFPELASLRVVVVTRGALPWPAPPSPFAMPEAAACGSGSQWFQSPFPRSSVPQPSGRPGHAPGPRMSAASVCARACPWAA